MKEHAANIAQDTGEIKTENTRNDKVIKEAKKLNHHAKNIIINYKLEKKDQSLINAVIEGHMCNDYLEHKEQSSMSDGSNILLASDQEEYCNSMKTYVELKMKQHKEECKGGVENNEESVEEED